MPHYLFLDTENNGLFDYSRPADAPGQPRVAQVGLLFVNHKYEIEGEHEFLIRPEGWEMTPEATVVNGITTEMLREHGVPIKEALDLYANGIDARRVISGFNISFDMKGMRAESRRNGMDDRYLQTRNLCLMWATRSIVGAVDSRGKVKVPSLQEACAFFKIEQPQAHSALADARSAYQLMLKLVERGALPEPKSPYDRKAKKPKSPNRAKAGLPGDDPELDADQEIPNFLGPSAGEQ